MKILQIMYFSCEDIYQYKKRGNEHQLHNLYGYDYFREVEDVSVFCIYPKASNNYFKSFPKINRLLFEFHLINLQIKCALISSKYDIIYSPHDFHLLPLAILRLLRICKKPIFSISHFAYNEKLIEKRSTRIYRIFERFFYYRGIDKISFLNDSILNLAVDAYNVPKLHRNSLNWGANLSFFNDFVQRMNVPSENKYFMTLGTQNRDYPSLIQALHKIDTQLMIFGRLNESEFINSPIPKNIIFDTTIIQGLNSVAKLRHYYYNSIAVLIPIIRMTDISNGASVIVEALAMGKPIIITDFPINYIDVEKEKIGFKIKPGDVNGWSNAIQWLLEHPLEGEEMGKRALQLAKEKYNYELFCIKILKTLKETCN
jgi:glycosyltransferase involved in cell wall biosynthesis